MYEELRFRFYILANPCAPLNAKYVLENDCSSAVVSLSCRGTVYFQLTGPKDHFIPRSAFYFMPRISSHAMSCHSPAAQYFMIQLAYKIDTVHESTAH